MQKVLSSLGLEKSLIYAGGDNLLQAAYFALDGSQRIVGFGGLKLSVSRESFEHY